LIALIVVGGFGCDRSQTIGAGSSADHQTKTEARQTGTGSERSAGRETPATGTNKTTLTLYFSDDQAMKLVKESREATQTAEPAAAAVRALIEGPKGAGLATIPAGARLNGITIKDGVATVDLSREFVDGLPGGSASERMAVYSIVNSLTEFNTIERVKFQIDGADVETIGGHLDATEPLGRDESLF
jgi:spore germination protein GerM